jgi:hypothetical protein
MKKVLRVACLGVLLGTSTCREPPSVEPPVPENRREPTSDEEVRASERLRLRSIYVPAYSHVAVDTRNRASETLLGITLSVRNVDAL